MAGGAPRGSVAAVSALAAHLPQRRSVLATWWGQLLLLAGMDVLYSLSRHVAVGDARAALAHARWIEGVQDALIPHVERTAQRAFGAPAAEWVFNHVYLAAQLLVVPAALVWLYHRRRSAYVALRDTVLATWLLALPVYALFPVAPPRLAGMGVADTVSAGSGLALDSRFALSFYNPLAAVPSLHCGFALAVSVAVGAAATTPWTRALAYAWAPLVALSVVVTGNHFALDVVAGWAVAGLGCAAGAAAHRALNRWRRSRIDAGRTRGAQGAHPESEADADQPADQHHRGHGRQRLEVTES